MGEARAARMGGKDGSEGTGLQAQRKGEKVINARAASVARLTIPANLEDIINKPKIQHSAEGNCDSKNKT